MLCGHGLIVDSEMNLFKCWQEVHTKEKALLNLRDSYDKPLRRLAMCTYPNQCTDGFHFPKWSLAHYAKNKETINYG